MFGSPSTVTGAYIRKGPQGGWGERWLFVTDCTGRLEILAVPFEDGLRLAYRQRGGIYALQLGGTTHRREDALDLSRSHLGLPQLGNVPLASNTDEARQHVFVRWG